MTMELKLKPRNETIAQLIEDCADGKIPFSGEDSLCSKISAMGFKITSLYEMVRAAEEARK
jgi:hypothetical protein